MRIALFTTTSLYPSMLLKVSLERSFDIWVVTGLGDIVPHAINDRTARNASSCFYPQHTCSFEKDDQPINALAKELHASVWFRRAPQLIRLYLSIQSQQHASRSSDAVLVQPEVSGTEACFSKSLAQHSRRISGQHLQHINTNLGKHDLRTDILARLLIKTLLITGRIITL